MGKGVIFIGFLLLTAIFTLPMGWAMMLLFGNLHVIFSAVPAISFTSAYSIAFPLAILLGSLRVNFDSN